MNSWKALLVHRCSCLCMHMGLGLFYQVKTWRTQRWHHAVWFYFWFCLPMIKILVFCALSYLQHSYSPFNMLEIVWFSVFLSSSPTITKDQESSFCGSKKFLSIIAWSRNICLPGKWAKWQCTYKKFELKRILQPEILGLQTIIWNLGISYLLPFRVSQHSSK